ncbi:hypothetical protein AIIKEEIJ_02482 [Rhodococcus sp. YH1]|nr:hypothetical protein [Rhodococcus sp. YH1]
MAGAVGADVGAARGAVDVGGDGLEKGAEGLVGLRGATGHDRRPVEGAFLAAGDAGADEVQAAFAQCGFAADGVGVEGVAAVDDDVAGFHRVREFLDDRVGGLAGLDHDEHPARLLQGGDELFDGFGAHEVAVVAVGFEQGVGLGDTAVVQRDGVAVAGEVTGDVRSHDGQAGHADLGAGILGAFDGHGYSFPRTRTGSKSGACYGWGRRRFTRRAAGGRVRSATARRPRWWGRRGSRRRRRTR